MPAYRMDLLGKETLVFLDGTKLAASCRAPYAWAHGRHCCKPSGFLCDAPVNEAGDTCDMPICSEHAQQIGADKHLCPKHAAEAPPAPAAPQKELF